jgi:hypothetical protein
MSGVYGFRKQDLPNKNKVISVMRKEQDLVT